MFGLEAFQYAFMQNALQAGLLVAAIAAPLGVLIVLRGQGMIGDGLAHIAFGGLALGFFLNAFPLGFALVFAIAAALGIQLLASRGVVLSDTAIAIFFTGGLAAGVILTYRAGGWNVDLLSFLFGSITGVRPEDLPLIRGLAILMLVTLVAFYKELFYTTFSDEGARVSGIPTGLLNAVFAILTATTIVIASRVIGLLLVSALIVIPAATALQFRAGFLLTLVLATALGGAAIFLGLWGSWVFDVPPSGSTAAASVLGFTAAAAYAGLRARFARGDGAAP